MKFRMTARSAFDYEASLIEWSKIGSKAYRDLEAAVNPATKTVRRTKEASDLFQIAGEI